jgi:hypothetical protein
MTKVLTNTLKKGVKVQMKNGLSGTLADNLKGNIRMVAVRGSEVGLFDETGSVYAHDIVSALVDGVWVGIEYTPAQLKCKSMVRGFGW